SSRASLCVCVCVCVAECVMWLCVCLNVSVCVCVCVPECVMWLCVCLSVSVCVCECVCECVCVHVKASWGHISCVSNAYMRVRLAHTQLDRKSTRLNSSHT